MPKKKFYITTAIDYPNSKPHLGHAYEKVMADILARWHRLNGEDVFFLTGTDEHGLKIYKAAKAQGKEPMQFVDEMLVFFKDLYSKLGISYDRFIRTTDKDHEKVCQEIFKKLDEKGDLYKGVYEGAYCTGCEAYYTEKDLVEGMCPVHKKAPEMMKEDTYFFKLGKYQEELIKHIEQHPDFILPESKRNEILNRLKEPLRDLSVTRTSFAWGVPVPKDPKHVMYVWLDALLNYVSGIGYPKAKFKKYWPADVHVIGKDINWFHSVIWPCELMSAGIELPKTVYIHGFINLNGEKLSKSAGIIIDPIKLIEEYGADAIRYYFAKEIPAGGDGSFTQELFVEKINSDLADVLGNLLQRTSVLIQKNFNGAIPKPGKFESIDEKLIEESQMYDALNELMQKFEWSKAIDKVWGFLRNCNKYINDTEPWKLKDNPGRLGTILYTLTECLRIASIYISPFLPETAEKISKQLGQKLGKGKDSKFKKNTKGTIPQPEILFKKHVIKAEDPFSKLNLKVGEITDVAEHPEADKLYVLQVNMGAERRQLVAGLRKYFKPDELKGKHILVVSNLKPAKLKDIESAGMLLAAERKEKVALLLAPKSAPGEQVYADGIEPCLSHEITIEEFQKAPLTTKDKKVMYKGKILKTKIEEIIADIDDNAKIR